MAAYRLAREQVPGLELALVGSMALDDPEGWDVYRQIRDAAAGDPRIHLLTNLTGVGNVEVNALQHLSRVVVQKSVREGFGLVVSEALWKRTPVVAGRTGGIPLQMADGAGGFLVERVDQAAAALVRLLDDAELAEELAERGWRRVRDRFLIPRLVLDELRLVAELVSSAPPSLDRWAGRDPVCGMAVPDHEAALRATIRSRDFVFCSEYCQSRFFADPAHFAPSLAAWRRGGAVSELRQDPTTLGWVLIAPERSRRPEAHQAEGRPSPPRFSSCPLCPGNENETPPEVWRLGSENGSWRIRVVPNRFPLLRTNGGPVAAWEGFRSMDGRGWHEVVVESPEHSWDMALGTEGEVRAVLDAYRARYRALRRKGAELVVVFRNHGAASGTSLEHPHSQVVGTPVIPRLVRSRIDVARQRHDDAGSCLYLELVERDLAAQSRVVLAGDQVVAFQPFAPSAAYETWIMPRFHQPSFGEVAPSLLDELAGMLRRVLGALRAALDDPAYNLVVHSAPAGEEHLRYFVWHLQITPRLGPAAGFELATGIPVVTVPPEESAARLRSLL